MASAVTCAGHPRGPSFVTACPKVRACPQGFLLVGLQEPYQDGDFCGSCSISRFAESPHFHRKRKYLCNAAATKKTAPLLSYWKDVDKNVRDEGKGNPEGWAGGCRERNRTRCWLRLSITGLLLSRATPRSTNILLISLFKSGLREFHSRGKHLAEEALHQADSIGVGSQFTVSLPRVFKGGEGNLNNPIEEQESSKAACLQPHGAGSIPKSSGASPRWRQAAVTAPPAALGSCR